MTRATRRGRPAAGRVVSAVLAAGVVACASGPRRGDTGIKPFGFDLWDVHCPSGMRVILERAPGSPWAAVTTVVGAGSVDDPPGREGLAHVVEHLTIVHSHGPNEAEMMQRLGNLETHERAFTWFNETVYPNLVPATLLGELVTIEGRRLLRPLEGVDEDTFAVERDIVRNELREGHETEARRESFDAAYRTAFPPEHPYSRPVIGTHDTLSAMTLDDARRFAAANYRPEAMTMVIVADMPIDRAETFVREHLPPELYGDPQHPRGLAAPPDVPKGAPPLAAARGLQRATGAVAAPELWIAWTTPGGYGPDRYTNQMWASIAYGNFYWDPGRDDPDIAGVDVFARPDTLASLFVCRVRLVRGDHPEESWRHVVDALPWTGGDDTYLARRFEHRRADALRELAFEGESARHRALERAEFAHFTGGANAYGALMDAARSITDDRALDFARRYLGPERARAVLVTPVSDSAGPGRAIAVAARPSPRVGHKPLPDYPLTNLTDMRYLGALRAGKLGNGMEVAVLPRPGAPVVTVSLAFHGGAVDAPPGVAAAAYEGLETHWQESPGDYGISYAFGIGRDATAVTMRAGAGNLVRVLEMMSYLVRSYEIDWPSDTFEASRLPLLRKEAATPARRNAEAFVERLFPDAPFGRIFTGDQIAAAKRGDAVAWMDAVVEPSNAVLVIVGDVDPAEAESAARSALGGWSGGEGPRRARAAALPGAAVSPRHALSAAWTLVAHRPAATQAEILLGCVLPPGDAKTAAVYEVTGRKIRSDILRPVRTRLGSTYDVEVEPISWRGGTTLLQLHSNVDNARLAVTVDVLRQFWTRAAAANLAADPGDVAHIQDIARSQARKRLVTLDGSAALAEELVDTWNRGWPWSSVDERARLLTSVTAAEVDATLRACANHLVFAVTGDADVVKAALAAGPSGTP